MSKPSTETLDRLYLEWSQFTKARTAREIYLSKALERIAGGEFDYLKDAMNYAREKLAVTP